MTKYLLRYFIDGKADCHKEHEFVLEPHAPLVIPRIGERVWLPNVEEDDDVTMSELCCEVTMVTYNPWDDGSGLFMVDIDVCDVTYQVLAELDDDCDCCGGGC